MAATSVLVLVMLIASVNALQDVYLSSAGVESGKTELIIETSIQGNIHWYTGYYDRLHVEVNKSVETIHVDVMRNDSNQFHLYIRNVPVTDPTESPSMTDPSSVTPTASGSTLRASQTVAFLLAVLGIVLVYGKSVRLELLLLLMVLFCSSHLFIHANDTPKADIHVYLPRDFVLKSVSLKSSVGGIRVDESLIEASTEVECLSGQFLQECPSCCNGHGQCVEGVCECGLSFNGTECDEQTDVTFKLYTNPSDPTIAVALTPEGDEIYAYGNKTAEGLPENIDQFVVVDTDGTETISELNEDGEVTSAVDSTGQKIDIIWENNYTALFVSAVLANGTQQVTVHIDLTDPDIDNDEVIVKKRSSPQHKHSMRQPIPADSTKTKSMNKAIPFSVKDRRPQNIPTVHKRNVAGDDEDSTLVRVAVTSCDEVVSDAYVSVEALIDYDDDTGTYESEETYPAVYDSSIGEYCAAIPSEPALGITADQVGEVCEGVLTGLGKVCDVYDKVDKVTKVFFNKDADVLICRAITIALKISPLLVLKVVPFYKLCKNAFKGVKWYCKVNDKVTSVPIDNPYEILCDSVTSLVDNFVNLFDNKKILLTPKALFAQGNTVEGVSKLVTLQKGSTTSLTLTDSVTSPQIVSYTSSPFDPVPFQNYIATVVYECYSASTFVHMSIVGTDGYSDSTTCTSGPVCQLYVPGAVELVLDTVTVTITDPSTTAVEQRTIYIVF